MPKYILISIFNVVVVLAKLIKKIVGFFNSPILLYFLISLFLRALEYYPKLLIIYYKRLKISSRDIKALKLRKYFIREKGILSNLYLSAFYYSNKLSKRKS
ncbi:uncharacterized protein LY79DRAFT_581232 [Colletotrichum navitas]|uniref:Uncharacterized protein n=1 Tax=Colletotrichum navitas TaxID=681940 RepID=A0AAD8PW54_9PEZI|nr:uncharacterized protein LY79DRAFT_581232 [Colletotrichum navitas]KAK1585286.1 hypothetical protein LY79DRAFT_581232 [Colletotrichum navitas]